MLEKPGFKTCIIFSSMKSSYQTIIIPLSLVVSNKPVTAFILSSVFSSTRVPFPLTASSVPLSVSLLTLSSSKDRSDLNLYVISWVSSYGTDHSKSSCGIWVTWEYSGGLVDGDSVCAGLKLESCFIYSQVLNMILKRLWQSFSEGLGTITIVLSNQETYHAIWSRFRLNGYQTLINACWRLHVRDAVKTLIGPWKWKLSIWQPNQSPIYGKGNGFQLRGTASESDGPIRYPGTISFYFSRRDKEETCPDCPARLG